MAFLLDVGRPLLGRAGDRLPVAHAGAQAFDMTVGQQFGELLRGGHAGTNAHAGGQANGAQHRVDMLDAVARHLREVEAFEDAERQQVLERFAGWRRHMHGAAAIVGGDWVDPFDLHVMQIVHGEHAAQLLQPVDQFLAERAAIQRLRSLGRDRLEGLGEIGLLQDRADLRRAALDAVDVVGLEGRRQGGVTAEFAAAALELLDVELDHRIAVARDLDRGREQLGELFGAVGADHLAPAAEIARRADGDRSAQKLFAVVELVERELARDRPHEGERAHALFLGNVDGGETLAREARHVGFDDVQRGGGRGGGIEGVAAVGQDARTGSGGQGMRRGHHSVPRCDGGTLAVLQHDPVSHEKRRWCRVPLAGTRAFCAVRSLSDNAPCN